MNSTNYFSNTDFRVFNNLYISKPKYAPTTLGEIVCLALVLGDNTRLRMPVNAVTKYHNFRATYYKVSNPSIIKCYLLSKLNMVSVKHLGHLYFYVCAAFMLHEHQHPARTRANIIFSHPTRPSFNYLPTGETLHINKLIAKCYSCSALSNIAAPYRAILSISISFNPVHCAKRLVAFGTLNRSVFIKAIRNLAVVSVLAALTAKLRASIKMADGNIPRLFANQARNSFTASLFRSHIFIVTHMDWQTNTLIPVIEESN